MRSDEVWHAWGIAGISSRSSTWKRCCMHACSVHRHIPGHCRILRCSERSRNLRFVVFLWSAAQQVVFSHPFCLDGSLPLHPQADSRPEGKWRQEPSTDASGLQPDQLCLFGGSSSALLEHLLELRHFFIPLEDWLHHTRHHADLVSGYAPLQHRLLVSSLDGQHPVELHYTPLAGVSSLMHSVQKRDRLQTLLESRPLVPSAQVMTVRPLNRYR